ncbi:MAG: hypothetical protein HY744_02730 [Deltaproteobacteria bacterium]|nr:hypothetical protein [Deltaproteobacteria bacterium]
MPPTCASPQCRQYGRRGDIPQPGLEFDGALGDELSVYRPSGGTWHFRNTSGSINTQRSIGTANKGVVPLAGLYDSDTLTDLVVYEPHMARFHPRPEMPASTLGLRRQPALSSELAMHHGFRNEQGTGARQTGELIAELDHLKSRFDAGTARAKRRLLRVLADRPVSRAADLLRYHEALCFLRAFPDDAEVLAGAEAELGGFVRRVDACRRAHGGELPSLLDNTGIAGTGYRYPFGLPMVRWLLSRFAGTLEIDWDEYESREDDTVGTVLTGLAGWVETAALDDELLGSQEWFERTRPRRGASALSRLVTRLDRSGLPAEIQETLFNNLNLTVRWDVGDCAGSRTLARLEEPEPFFHQGPLRGRTADLRGEICRSLPRVPPARPARARRLLDLARCALAVRERELYPIALGNLAEVYEMPVGQGVRIMLYGMQPDRRLPIETDFGAFVVKNGMPVGYGVGALLLDRVEIAANVFPTFRGGESAFVFEQFARLFHHQFGVRVFLVERYQLGHENDEGLDSGSFWFYYKLGFRSLDPRVRALAEQEAARLRREPGARTARSLLRRLARSNVVLSLDGRGPEAWQEISLTEVGLAVTRFIEERCGGDRARAEAACAPRAAALLGLASPRGWPAAERAAFTRLSPLVLLLPGLADWPAADRRALGRLLRAKGAPQEAGYARLAVKYERLHRALLELGGSPR